MRLLNQLAWLSMVVGAGLGAAGDLAAEAPAPGGATSSKRPNPKPASNPPRPLPADHAERMTRGLDLFTKQVRGLLKERCLKCHGGESTEGELNLATREGLLKGGGSGAAVVPFDAAASHVLALVRREKEPYMPEEGKPLTKEEAEAFAKWIDLGAPYDRSLLDSAEAKVAWMDRKTPAAARDFWSFRPLRRVDPPTASRPKEWTTNPVDRFIFSSMKAKGLSPNPPADRRVLARRMSLDLLGLPPTPEEIDRFVHDRSPNAVADYAARLLASPHFGERWGRHWLDVARFAESHGFEHDYDRPFAYHYRDFVIQAFNQDLPYDTFVRWQIAGDEIAPQAPLALMATGFLAAGVHSTQITKNEVEKHRYDELDDMVATIGTSMLGLTVGCARCHDHKYDPLPQGDYYRLASIFTKTVRVEMDVNFDPEGYKRAKVEFDAAHAPFEARLAAYEKDELPSKLAAWESGRKSSQGSADPFPWKILEPSTVKSQGGAKFAKQPDGSYLASGPNAQHDAYTFVVPTDLVGITGLRIEALADPSLAHNGPGRAANGNFALTNVILSVAPKASPTKGEAVKLTAARASFEQKGLPIAAAIDNDDISGWAVDPKFGADHQAAFATEKPIGYPGGSILTVTLKFQGNVGHNIGRPRLAVTSAGPVVALKAESIPLSVAEILNKPTDKRPAAERTAALTWFRGVDPGWKALDAARRDHLAKAPPPSIKKVLVSTEGLPAVRLHSQGEDFLPATHYLRRGDTNLKDGEAEPGYLQILSPAGGSSAKWRSEPPKGAKSSYRRRALAEWLTDTQDGAGALLARVIVNRLWQHHMGRGIVATPSDFGTRGAPPSHPELLEYLANELVANGWRLKPIHALIVTSATYQQASADDPAKRKIDPENHLFWRFAPRRLEGEAIRDCLLAVSGALDRTMFGPGTLDDASKRRSIYFMVKRSKLIPMMQAFDGPDALQSVAERPRTTVAPQALYLMNNPQARELAERFAKRIEATGSADPKTLVEQAYQWALGRPPTKDEAADAAAFLIDQGSRYARRNGKSAQSRALADFCQTLFWTSEFLYLE